MCDYRRGLDWWIDLLTTYTHDSELQAVTAPPLISTIHKSPQHQLNILQPTVSSPTVPWQRLLTVEILQLHALNSCLHGTELTTDKAPDLSVITFRHGPHSKHSSSIVASNCCVINNLLPSNGNVFTEPLPRNGRCLQSHGLAVGLCATIWSNVLGKEV
jgi:hypothetical protein